MFRVYTRLTICTCLLYIHVTRCIQYIVWHTCIHGYTWYVCHVTMYTMHRHRNTWYVYHQNDMEIRRISYMYIWYTWCMYISRVSVSFWWYACLVFPYRFDDINFTCFHIVLVCWKYSLLHLDIETFLYRWCDMGVSRAKWRTFLKCLQQVPFARRSDARLPYPTPTGGNRVCMTRQGDPSLRLPTNRGR